ncbi:MAG: UbiH/UbiF/VisC/COQ6 family ubiquinone biosynthesis hydroxylase [Pseudomonadales bacterium]
MDDSNYDVVIVGGGLTGLALASALGHSRLSVTVLEAGKPPSPRQERELKKRRKGFELHAGIEPRVSAINPATRKFLHRTGAWSKCAIERFAPFTRMLVWDARGTSQIEFDADMIDEECLGHIAENRELMLGLYKRVRELDNVDVRYETSVNDIKNGAEGKQVILADGTPVSYSLLVGADGGNSRVRELAGLRTYRWRYDQEALVTTVETELPHGFTARQSFTPSGPLAFLPLANEKLCSIVWSSRETEHLKEISDQALCRELGKASGFILGNVSGVDKRYSFPLYQQHAMRYTRANLALVGDAAHTIHPLAGQGANLGFADANALAIELSQCRFTSESPGSGDLLARYERRRKVDNVLMASVMEGLKRLYDIDEPALAWLRNTGMRWVNSNDAVKARLIRLAAGS